MEQQLDCQLAAPPMEDEPEQNCDDHDENDPMERELSHAEILGDLERRVT